MIKSRSITAICCIAIAAAILFTCLFAAGKLPFITSGGGNNGSSYADNLFDTSYVHSINIEVNQSDWQSMLENAMAEEYISCNVTIDGTEIKNAAIRTKGNSSLTTVQSSGSDRYSFKIELDHYDDGTSYLGLDKLCLNNIVQDNTYMKDYFSYRMMNEMNAYAPLCSYIYITVNNEDWGLYLAVEAIEEAYAKRNFGTNFGEIYKPDTSNDRVGGNGNGGSPPEMLPGDNGGQATDIGQERPGMQDFAENEPPADIIENTEQASGDEMRGGGKDRDTDDTRENNDRGFGGMGSSAVALIYQDDDIDSYSEIFDNSVFNPNTADKKRLINSIKQLNYGENLEEAVNVDEVLRYFVVHNFTVNFDSYTGSLMHNYYLYEDNGQMSMIAWDYNLAFGGFGAGGGPGGMGGTNSSTDTATQFVNYPIDTPLSGASLEDRPMLGKLLENTEYMERYHELFNEFLTDYIDSGKFENEYNYIFGLISKYVQKDPTKFCTFDEFVTGAETLKQFCLLRCESIRGQLDGTIPSTNDGQNADLSNFADASDISIDAMGSMGSGGGFGGGGRADFRSEQNQSTETALADSADTEQTGHTEQLEQTEQLGETAQHEQGQFKQTEQSDQPKQPEQSEQAAQSEASGFEGQKSDNGKGGFTRGEPNAGQNQQSSANNLVEYAWLIICILILTAAIVFVKLYGNRKK